MHAPCCLIHTSIHSLLSPIDPSTTTLLLNPPIHHHLPNRFNALLNRHLRALQLVSPTHPTKKRLASLTALNFFTCSASPSVPASTFGKSNSNIYVRCKSDASPDGPSEIMLRIIVPSSCSKSTCLMPSSASSHQTHPQFHASLHPFPPHPRTNKNINIPNSATTPYTPPSPSASAPRPLQIALRA
jgi:hypothetical protein